MQLQKVNIIGTCQYHVFERDGKEFRIPCTKQDYTKLSTNNPKKPTNPLGQWKYSYVSPLFDTESGDLEEGTYAEEGGEYIIRVPNRDVFSLPLDKIQNGILDPDLIPLT